MSTKGTSIPGLTYLEDPDYGVWTRAVERVVDALDLDWWPAEALVLDRVQELGLTDPDLDDQMEQLEDELIALLGDY
jgi:hypothetical protein